MVKSKCICKDCGAWNDPQEICACHKAEGNDEPRKQDSEKPVNSTKTRLITPGGKPLLLDYINAEPTL